MERSIVEWSVGLALVLSIAGIATNPCTSQAQVRPASPSAGLRRFEVASVKRCVDSNPGTNAGGTNVGSLRLHCLPVSIIIRRAYLLFADGTRNPRSQVIKITGGPAWIDSELYDIEAKAEGNPGAGIMAGPMVQSLLEERFKLKVHRETKDGPVYAMTLARNGPKVPVAKQACWTALGKEPRPVAVVGQPPRPECGAAQFRQNGFDLPGATMADFCVALSITAGPQKLDRVAIDKTGLTGDFDFHFDWPPADVGLSDASGAAAGAASRADSLPTFQSALDRLGLRLEPAKGPVETLVIDHVERPTPN